eukprot:GGOE01014139.1.p1 GENE.GGOE01014139.1~~GGOE01014139.1.p1  ORF type:complete len:430 (-),score=83.25 GGOE01014139.1:300-1532(-)
MFAVQCGAHIVEAVTVPDKHPIEVDPTTSSTIVTSAPSCCAVALEHAPVSQPSDTSLGNCTPAVELSRGGRIAHHWLEKVKAVVVKNFLLVCFAIAVTVALSWPEPGCYVGSWKFGTVRMMQALNNAIVFFISGLTLKNSEFKQVLTYWKAFLYGMISILVLTPCLGFATKEMPLSPPEFVIGLTIFCVVPTTLGVGVALVSAAKGNQTLALLLTVASNLAGILTVPYELQLILRNSSTVSVDPVDLLIKLVCTVLVPTVIGNLLSTHVRQLAELVAKYRVQLGMVSSANLAFIVWQTLSGARDVLLQVPYPSLLIILGFTLGQHLFYLSFNALAAYLLRLSIRESVATVVMASQKSAPVAVTVITYITSDVVQQGLLAIPGLFGQILQIFVGSVLVHFLARLVEKESQD